MNSGHSAIDGRNALAVGASAILLALAFNVPFAILGSIYDYPDILRAAPGEALERFRMGGATLVLVWHAFAWCAFAFIPVSMALALRPRRLRETPSLAIAAAVVGALSGLAQAIGLWRWVFVIPALAAAHGDAGGAETGGAAAEQAFDILNRYGGVAIGEHLGQLLTALFVATVVGMQWREGARTTAAVGAVTAAAIAFGTTEGVMLGIGLSGEPYATFQIVGYGGLTLWLIASGVQVLRERG